MVHYCLHFEFLYLDYFILYNFDLCFFWPIQKEIALYTASKINSEFAWFDIDADIDPLFKVIFCQAWFYFQFLISFLVTHIEIESLNSVYSYWTRNA